MTHGSALSLTALLVIFLWHGPEALAEGDPPVHDCDRHAADPFDPDKIVAGILYERLDPAKALAACEAAARDFPNVPRFQLQYARALTKAERYIDAESYWRRLAEEGHPLAEHNIGFFFAEGKGSFSKNAAEAVRWLKKAAEQGYAPAQSYLGAINAHGQGIPQDYSTAMDWFRKAAAQGEPTAQTWLGWIYLQGLGGIPQDHAEAAKWFQKSAEQNYPYAQAWLGAMYAQGQGVSQDYGKAAGLLKRAAEQGESTAQNWLGWLYENGHGLAQDHAEAKRWYEKAAAQGVADAKAALERLDAATSSTSAQAEQPPVHDCDRIAASPYDGRAVAPAVSEQDIDAESAIRVCEAALDEFPNTPRFQAQLGRAFYERSQNHKAVEWWRKAADQGYAYAMFALGTMYQHGLGVPRDDAQAVAWYSEAVKQGHGAAQSILGWMYQEGRGVPQDYTLALAWYRGAAAQGDARGQSSLGYMYQHGLGVPQDYAQAMAWYRQAADQDYAAAMNNLGYMYSHGLGVTQDYAEAMVWYRQAADQGFAAAQSNVGWMYQHGLGVARDYAQAVAWYRKAVEHGHAESQDELEEAEARLASLNAFKPFLDQAGAKNWVDMKELVANPFVYQDEKLAVAVTFETMLSKDQALFSHGGLSEVMGRLFTQSSQTLSGLAEFVVVSNIPAGRFTRGGEWVLLVGRVEGKEHVKVPMGGELLLTHLEYVDARACQRTDCK